LTVAPLVLQASPYYIGFYLKVPQIKRGLTGQGKKGVRQVPQ
jgi:hypothetical protein